MVQAGNLSGMEGNCRGMLAMRGGEVGGLGGKKGRLYPKAPVPHLRDSRAEVASRNMCSQLRAPGQHW